MHVFWLIWFLKIFFSINIVNGEKPFVLKLERVDVKYVDDTCVQNLTASVTKANRTAPYVLNLSMYVLKPWYDNVTVSSTSYEFKNNQYKKSFIQTSNTACDLIIEGEQFFIELVRKHSNLPKKCPMPIGLFTLKGMTLVESFFPTGFPISKWRFNYIVKGTASNISIMKVDIYFNAEPRLKAKGKNGKSKS